MKTPKQDLKKLVGYMKRHYLLNEEKNIEELAPGLLLVTGFSPYEGAPVVEVLYLNSHFRRHGHGDEHTVIDKRWFKVRLVTVFAEMLTTSGYAPLFEHPREYPNKRESPETRMTIRHFIESLKPTVAALRR